MKKLFILLTFALFISCSQPQKNKSQEATKDVKYIYEATYLDDFEIGNAELVVKVQEMIQAIINKNYEKAGSYLSDNVVFTLQDGSRLEGKDECVKYMESYSSVEVEDYQIAVNLALLDENGDEWVLLWDTANIVSQDGKSAGVNWMETFRFRNGKIDYMNQFSKPRNNN